MFEAELDGVEITVEETATEAAALVDFLVREGARAWLAPRDELAGEIVFLDVWTPEIDPRVVALRRRGVFVTCLADLVLARAGSRTLAVTGTAGKTTTTAFTAQLLRAAGLDVCLPEPGPSFNRWPDATVLPELVGGKRLVVELTSSHLAFSSHSPEIAVVTALWPDHVELHGSFESYARAKTRIVAAQTEDDWLVVPAGDECECFVAASTARVGRFSVSAPVADGVFVRGDRVVARWADEEDEIGALEQLPVRGRTLANALAAATGALAAGAPVEAVREGLPQLELPPHRLVEVGRVDGVPVVDDSMAGTPAKAAAALELYPDASVVLVAGGMADGAMGAIHATAEEQALLADACALARVKTRRVIVFGPAAARLAELLPGAEPAGDLAEAVERALAAAKGAAVVLIAPMFPVAPSDRDRLPGLVRELREASGSDHLV